MARGRVDGQPAFVLHSYPFRETSLIVEVFSRDFGRLALLARGARRPRSALRGLLMAFQPLDIGWSGKGEVPTLMKAEWRGGQPVLGGTALFCGYYLNELLMHLMAREDPHERLFESYARILVKLGNATGSETEAALREFERNLLQELGYGLTLNVDHAGKAIEAEQRYVYRPEQGAIPESEAHPSETAVHGQSLIDLAAGDFSAARTRAEGKWLMRSLIAHQLGGVELESRKIFKELLDL